MNNKKNPKKYYNDKLYANISNNLWLIVYDYNKQLNKSMRDKEFISNLNYY